MLFTDINAKIQTKGTYQQSAVQCLKTFRHQTLTCFAQPRPPSVLQRKLAKLTLLNQAMRPVFTEFVS